MYLLDTNVVSEMRKGALANAGVTKFLRNSDEGKFFLSVLTIGEMRRGVENVRGRGDDAQADRLEAWLGMITDEYADRILGFDSDCAQVWGRLMSPDASHPIDKQIAAIALIYGLDVVTRNVRDFSTTGVKLLNPFE